jgi:hypothetical protein
VDGYVVDAGSGVFTFDGDTVWHAGNFNPSSYYLATNPSGYQTASQVSTAISNLVDSSPATLDTLNELAAALGDDPNFATTVSNSIGTKAKAGDTMTGDLSFEKEIPRITLNMASDVAGNGGRIIFADASSVQDVQLRYNHFDSERPPFGLIVERGPGNTSTDKSYLQVQGEIYADSTQRVFHDGFHPNADTWTTARTLNNRKHW